MVPSQTLQCCWPVVVVKKDMGLVGPSSGLAGLGVTQSSTLALLAMLRMVGQQCGHALGAVLHSACLGTKGAAPQPTCCQGGRVAKGQPGCTLHSGVQV